MRKVLIVAAIILLVFLAACSEQQMQAKPLRQSSPTAAVTAAQTSTQETESTKTAAEAIQDLKAEQLAAPVVSGPKVGSTGMPPAPSGVTGLDALKARMKLLYKQSEPVDGVGAVDTGFGSRFNDLPSGYGNDGSAGE